MTHTCVNLLEIQKQTCSKALSQKYFNSMALQFQYALTFEEEADFCGEYKTQTRKFLALH